MSKLCTYCTHIHALKLRFNVRARMHNHTTNRNFTDEQSQGWNFNLEEYTPLYCTQPAHARNTLFDDAYARTHL